MKRFGFFNNEIATGTLESGGWVTSWMQQLTGVNISSLIDACFFIKQSIWSGRRDISVQIMSIGNLNVYTNKIKCLTD